VKNRINRLVLKVSNGKIRFSEKAYIFLLCLLLSTFFWFLSSLSDIYTTTLSVKLKYNSLDESFILTEEPPKQLSFKARSSGFELLGEQLSLNRNEVEVNLQDAKSEKNNRFFILTSVVKPSIREELDADIELLDLESDTLWLSTEERLKKKVKVIPQVDLSFKAAYKLRSKIELNPKTVEVLGPKSFIDSLLEIKTALYKAKNIDDSIKVKLKLIAPANVNGFRIEPEEVEILIPVEKYTEKQLTVPVKVNNEMSQNLIIRTFPDEVELTFLVPISKFNSLSASRLDAVVDYNKESSKSQKLKISLQNLPDYAVLRKIEPERVEYIIRK